MSYKKTGSEWVKTIDDACEHRYAEEYAHGEHCHQQSFRWGFQEGVDWLEKQGVQKFVDKCKDCNNVKGCITCTDGDQYAHITEQKPAWSEEDEQRIESAIEHLENSISDTPSSLRPYVRKDIDWLKSLKERIKGE